jgi:hypothetical protein
MVAPEQRQASAAPCREITVAGVALGVLAGVIMTVRL